MTLNRIRKGDAAALATLLDEEWEGLIRFLESRGASHADAEDAAQEAFVRLWARRDRWTEGSARALVYRIALNRLSDGRRRSRVRLAWTRSARRTPAPAPATPEDELIESEARSRCRAAIDALPERRREVFRLVRNEGFSYREVAEALELSPQTVANHMSLALRELRAALGDVLGPVESPGTGPDGRRSNDG